LLKCEYRATTFILTYIHLTYCKYCTVYILAYIHLTVNIVVNIVRRAHLIAIKAAARSSAGFSG
jgi:hypothetical protein